MTATTKTLIRAGYVARVEASPDRIYYDSGFKAVGAEIVPARSWIDAPVDNMILGLKQLPANGTEASRGGPFPKILAVGIVRNGVYLVAHRVPPFTTLESLSTPERRLRVSYNPNNKNNPIPVYFGYRSLDSLTISAPGTFDEPKLRVVAVDRLSTVIARSASYEYSDFSPVF
ncbi:hypothetical protein F5Y10DRAFT_287825 [Nemania abortiva]|nr:hypothetical protein F5Y10DRAFT_287825 [Nemania abortiva]